MDNIAKENFAYKKSLYAFVFIVLVLFVGIFFYSKGYRVTKRLTFGKIGTVKIIIPEKGTSLFIDQSKKIVTSRDLEEVAVSFSPTKHSIIVSNEKYYPWKKDFNVKSGETISFSPIFVNINPTGQIITKQDPEYIKIRNQILLDPLPTEKNPRISKDEKTRLWLEDNGIVASMGSTTTKVIQADTIIRNLNFYKERNDAVIFSTDVGIYVVEVTNEEEKNFMPVYKGQSPAFVITDNNFIYVLDSEILMQVVI